MTPEQEASDEDEDWVNSTPQDDVQVQVFRKPPHIKDILYTGSLAHVDMPTSAAIPAINPSSTDAIMSHICGDTPDKFASVIGTLLTPEIQNKSLVPRVPTKDLHAPKPQITDALRRINATDPFLPSARMTPDHEFAIVPRQRGTTQLPPHMRLDEGIADAPEHVTAVETIINQAIVTFHQKHQRLPHSITVNMIRFAQHWINTRNHKLFFYHTEYGDVEIPIQAGATGELLINEVRLD
jgi:hypothetical protein